MWEKVRDFQNYNIFINLLYNNKNLVYVCYCTPFMVLSPKKLTFGLSCLYYFINILIQWIGHRHQSEYEQFICELLHFSNTDTLNWAMQKISPASTFAFLNTTSFICFHRPQIKVIQTSHQIMFPLWLSFIRWKCWKCSLVAMYIHDPYPSIIHVPHF